MTCRVQACRLSPRSDIRGALLARYRSLGALVLDDGNESFQPSNLEITAVETASRATNVIPGWARAQLNIRFNNLQRGADLVDLVRRTAQAAAPGASVEAKISGEAFLTPPGPIYEIVSACDRCETAKGPASTHGGTSDGRFLIAPACGHFGLPTRPCTNWTTARGRHPARPGS